MIRLQPASILFPYPTLFRSRRENQRAVAVLHQTTSAGDQVGDRDRGAADDRPPRTDRGGTRTQRAGNPACAHLERTGADDGEPAVGVITGENGGTAAVLFDAAVAGNQIAHRPRVTAVESHVSAVGAVAGPACAVCS